MFISIHILIIIYIVTYQYLSFYLYISLVSVKWLKKDLLLVKHSFINMTFYEPRNRENNHFYMWFPPLGMNDLVKAHSLKLINQELEVEVYYLTLYRFSQPKLILLVKADWRRRKKSRAMLPETPCLSQ